MNNSSSIFEHIYRKEGLAPWTFEEPSKELVKLVESGAIDPCKALDVGCGEVTYRLTWRPKVLT